MIELSSSEFSMVTEILSTFVPGCEVRVFGSRVKGNASRYSDLDLVIVGKDQIDPLQIERLKDAFSESDLPFQVDVLDWNSVSEEFRRVIERKYEILPLSTQKERCL